jgi:hypothetical protein
VPGSASGSANDRYMRRTDGCDGIHDPFAKPLRGGGCLERFKMLTLEQRATNNETFRHIERVRNLLNACVVELLKRGELHDQTKLESPEVEVFAEYTPKLAGSTYGSDEYKGFLDAIKPALQHHYAHNRHHPEHHRNGVDDMNLLDIVEMLCDWKAASERHNDGNIRKSIEINANRFGLSPQLVKILENTADLLFR